jgi:hypothetical protein
MVRALADGFRLKHDIQSRENKRHENEGRESWWRNKRLVLLGQVMNEWLVIVIQYLDVINEL